MKDIQSVIDAITPEAYERLCVGVETGRWPDGKALTEEQKTFAQQAVMLYQSQHNHDADHMTIAVGGEMKLKSKRELKSDWSGEAVLPIKQVED